MPFEFHNINPGEMPVPGIPPGHDEFRVPLTPEQRKKFAELQESHNIAVARMKSFEKAKLDAEFAFKTFWGSINKDHKLFGKHAVIDEETMEVRISK